MSDMTRLKLMNYNVANIGVDTLAEIIAEQDLEVTKLISTLKQVKLLLTSNTHHERKALRIIEKVLEGRSKDVAL